MKKLLFPVILFFSAIQLQAQSDSSLRIDNTTTVDLIRQAEHIHLADSLKEALLLEQINALEKNETRQKQLIKEQLNELRYRDSLHSIELHNRIDSLKRHAHGAPVIIGKDTLCLIYTNIGSFTPSERVNHYMERITETAKHFALPLDSLYIQHNRTTSDILFKDNILISITEQDAIWENTNKENLALLFKDKLLHVIANYQDDISLANRLKQIGLCLMVILIQYLLIKLVNYCFRRGIDEKIKRKKDELFTGIKVRDFEIVNSEKQTKALLFLSKIARYLVNIIQLYITIPILFSIFPVTQRLAETLFGWILSPVTTTLKSFIAYLPKLFTIIVIIIIMRYIMKFIKYIASEIETEKLKVPGFYPDWAKATYNILRIFLYAFTLVIIFPFLPRSETEIFKGVSVFIGIVFSLGSSSIIANIVAGMVITYMRPFKIGDRIKIGEITGDVVEKSPFVTRIKTHKNEIITIPNSNILSSSVVNYSFSASENGLVIHTTVTIGYDVPWRQVHALLLKAASRTKNLLDEPNPFVLQTSLDDFYVSYQLCAYTKEASIQADIYSELHQNIQDCFNEEQVEIMSPHYRANRNGDATTVPANYMNKK